MTDHRRRLHQLAESVLEVVGTQAEAEVRVTGGTSALTRFANSFIHQNVGEEGEAISLKVSVGGRVASANTTHTDGAAIVDFVDRTIETARLQPVDESWPGLTPPVEVTDVGHFDDATAEASPADRAERVRQFVDAGSDMRAAGYCQTIGGSVLFTNSAGHRAEGRYSQAIIDGIHQTDTSAGSGHGASSRLGDLDAGAIGGLAAQRARDSMSMYDTKPGDYEVVLAPECVATIAVFLGFYGFNAKLHAEGQSFADLGAQQFDEAFHLWDDATDEMALGLGFDTEGTPKRRVDLVDAGVTRSLAHDRRTARRAGIESTGHAVPGSEVWGPFASNMMVGAGTSSVDDLIASVDRGLYVSTFNYCRVLDPKSLAVTGLTRNGTFMIENGEITGAVTNLRFTQSFVEALSPGRLLGLGNDQRFADSEFGAGIVRAPSMRLAGWNFTGGAEG